MRAWEGTWYNMSMRTLVKGHGDAGLWAALAVLLPFTVLGLHIVNDGNQDYHIAYYAEIVIANIIK